MVPAVPRLKRRPEFLRVARTRRKWVARGLILQMRRHAPDHGPGGEAAAVRVGFTVSRKVGGAVTRNRVRRRLRAAAEQILPVHARAGHDFVIIGRAAALKRPFPGLIEDLKTALRKLDAYAENAAANGRRQGKG